MCCALDGGVPANDKLCHSIAHDIGARMPSSSSGARVTPFHEQVLKTALLPVERTGGEWAKLGVRS